MIRTRTATSSRGDFEVELDFRARTITPRGVLNDSTRGLLFAAASALAREQPGDLVIELQHVIGVDDAFLSALTVMRVGQSPEHTTSVALAGHILRGADLAGITAWA